MPIELWWWEGPEGGIGTALGRKSLKVAPPLTYLCDIDRGLIVLKNCVFRTPLDDPFVLVTQTHEEISINNTTHISNEG